MRSFHRAGKIKFLGERDLTNRVIKTLERGGVINILNVKILS